MRGAHFRRRPRARLALGAAVVALAVSTGAAAATLSVRPQAGQAAAPAIVVHRVSGASFVPQYRTEPFFVLVIGNDARSGLVGVRADAIHLIGVNPAANSATIVNIPRDTYVSIPGSRSDKINAAYEYGGLWTQMATVSEFTGVSFSFVVETNFDGFMALVDEMGGLDVDIPMRMFDTNSGADFEAGPNHLQGEGALSLARNRHLPNGDISRTANQGLLLVAGLARAREASGSPFDSVRLLGLLARHAHYEGGGLRELYSLISTALSIDPASVHTVTMPATIGQVGAASVVFAGDGSAELFADFADDAILQGYYR